MPSHNQENVIFISVEQTAIYSDFADGKVPQEMLQPKDSSPLWKQRLTSCRMGYG